MNPHVHSYTSMGTEWKVTVWDAIPQEKFSSLMQSIMSRSEDFDATYSRFKKDSFVSLLSQKKGTIVVQEDFMNMLLWYRKLYIPSGKKINPLIGFTISDLGYDAEYSLVPQKHIRQTPDLFETIEVLDEKTISIKEPVLFDFGALGKGYFIDVIGNILRQAGLERFLVDGSGDVLYEGSGFPIEIGLEHPNDNTKVIGKVSVEKGSVCSSGTNRRRWANHTHMIDPHTTTSVEEFIIASWVISDTAVYADGVATSLFFVDPSELSSLSSFQYCLLNKNMEIKKSPHFGGEFFI